MTQVLLIADNKEDARTVKRLLDPPEFDLINLLSIDEAIEVLKKPNNVDIILSDIALRDQKGKHSIQKLRRVTANLPVIFFSSTQDNSLAAAALQEGAQDYLLKGQFVGETLKRSIHYAIERKRFQKAAERARAKTRQLRQNARLLEREREQLMRLSQAKEEFISLASHQLRTPATGVKQYINMLLQGFAGDLTSQQRQILEQANQSNERQLKIVHDLLQTAHLDSGRVELTPSQVNLNLLIDEIIDEQISQFEARKQKIKFSASSPNIEVYVDGRNIRMALENIIDNAGKYSLNNTIINVTLSDKPKKVELIIEDHGVGIDNKDLAKVFSKFARVTNPLSDDVGGSGLGLYWSKSIIDLHGGKIKVESTLGKGTTFTICLPKKGQSLND
jgi:signal transduction histidine kinase